MVSKVFEKLINNRLVDHLEKCSFFLDFQYQIQLSENLQLIKKTFRTADLLTVVSDTIARAFKRSRATHTVALDISKTFNSYWDAGLLDKSLMEFQVRYLALFYLFSVIDGFKWF